MVRFSSCDIRLFDTHIPPITRSVHRSKSSNTTRSPLRRHQIIAHSLHMFLISQPQYPGVNAHNLFQTSVFHNSSCTSIGFKCKLKIASLSVISGLSTVMCLSKRPHRVNYLSNISHRFVPHSTTTPVLQVNPSISVKSAFSVWSRSSLPPPPPPPPSRDLPTASISSMKIIDGAFHLAC